MERLGATGTEPLASSQVAILRIASEGIHPHMQITVRLFASYAETLGANSIALDLDPGATAGDALDRVRSLANGGRGSLPTRPMLAVNERYTRPEHVLASGDEVAIIPPVAGG